MTNLPLLVAFVAGVISFLSPCVLPLIPGYVAYLAGTTVSDARRQRRAVIVNSLCFVFGFALVFALLGVALNTLLSRVAYDAQIWLSRIGGFLIIVFGLYLTGILKLPWLDRKYKLRVRTQFHSKYLSSVVFGAAFAAGWTPCVGAVLGGILGLATAQPGSAFVLLLSYATGFGLPFILVGFATAPAALFIARYSRWVKPLHVVFGLLLVILGTLIFTQTLPRLANFELLNRILK